EHMQAPPQANASASHRRVTGILLGEIASEFYDRPPADECPHGITNLRFVGWPGRPERTMRCLVVSLVLVSTPTSYAHFHMLLPEKHSIKEGEQVVVTYQFGHPFEHELGDAEKPVRATAFAPDGKSTDLLPDLGKADLSAADGKKVVGYRFTFRPS